MLYDKASPPPFVSSFSSTDEHGKLGGLSIGYVCFPPIADI
jgi:hypothetical protein